MDNNAPTLRNEIEDFAKWGNFTWKNYAVRPVNNVFWPGKEIIYIWSVLLSQALMAIFIGVILQLIWEDRPITEPL